MYTKLEEGSLACSNAANANVARIDALGQVVTDRVFDAAPELVRDMVGCTS